MGNKPHKSADQPEPGSTTPAWMITFSDLSTLLFTFFVLILSMSSMDRKTIKSMFHNFGSGFLYFKEYGEVSRPKSALMQGLREELKDSLIINKTDEAPRDSVAAREERIFDRTGTNLVVENFKGGFKLVFGHKLLFPTGSAEINQDMKPVLEKVGTFMSNSDYQVYIDGHTDNIPIRGGNYSSNEELSLARALSLMDYFVRQHGVDPLSIALAGYGDLHPTAPHDSSEGRSQNRRVEIIFKNQKYY